MTIEVLPDADAVARAAAAFIAAEAREAAALRGKFTIAVSGGRTPWVMLRALANETVPWEQVHLFQVDERIAPAGAPDRNLTHLRESLGTPLPPLNLHPMPVEAADPVDASSRYSRLMWDVVGSPPMFDLIHLGLGADGHTASLVPADPVLEAADHDVAITGVYQGRRRMTLTYPAINRARRLLWVVTGADKAPQLPRLRDGDPSIPAGRVARDAAMVLADPAAAAQLGTL
jgi:6-phosphogluconolactonase